MIVFGGEDESCCCDWSGGEPDLELGDLGARVPTFFSYSAEDCLTPV